MNYSTCRGCKGHYHLENDNTCTTTGNYSSIVKDRNITMNYSTSRGCKGHYHLENDNTCTTTGNHSPIVKDKIIIINHSTNKGSFDLNNSSGLCSITLLIISQVKYPPLRVSERISHSNTSDHASGIFGDLQDR